MSIGRERILRKLKTVFLKLSEKGCSKQEKYVFNLEVCLTLFPHHEDPLICLMMRIFCQLLQNVLTTMQADLSRLAQMDWETKPYENLGARKEVQMA